MIRPEPKKQSLYLKVQMTHDMSIFPITLYIFDTFIRYRVDEFRNPFSEAKPRIPRYLKHERLYNHQVSRMHSTFFKEIHHHHIHKINRNEL